MRRPWSRTLLVGVGVAAAAGATWLLSRDAAEPNRAVRVVQRLDQPLELQDRARHSGEAATTARYRWSADEIATSWATVATRTSVTLRSPRLELPPDDLLAITVTLPASAASERALLLWSERPTLSREDYLRNRRELSPASGGPTTVVIRGEDLRADAPQAVRYLFLHLPTPGARDGRTRPPLPVGPLAGVQSVAVLVTSDLTAAAPVGRARVVIGGEVRDVVYSRGPGVSYRVDVPPRAELRFGLWVTGAAVSLQARVTAAANGRETTLFDQPVTGGAWHDASVPVPVGAGTIVSLSTNAGGSGPAVYWSAPLLVAPEPEIDAPNVVLYVVDSLRADRLGIYGAARSVSPVLDDLGRRGLVYERAYAAASWTKPSITSLLTSLHPETHGLGSRYYTDPLPDSVVTLQDALRADGYVTAQFTANPLAGTLSNLDKGFDWSLLPDAFGRARASDARPKIGADDLNARIVPWIESHARERFLLYIQSIDAHPPFVAPGAGPAGNALADYDAAIAFNDREIGRLYQRLVDLGLASGTLLIVTADHGEAFGEHGRTGHGQSVYDEEVRVPLVVHWPGQVPSGRIEDPVHLNDVLPTILTYCSVVFDRDRFQGRALPRPGASGAPRPVIVTKFVYPEDLDVTDANHAESRAVVTFPWKLIASDEADGGRRLALYDLGADPLERLDLAPFQPERVGRLNDFLDRFLRDQATARRRFLAEHGGPPGGRAGGVAAPRRLPSRETLEQLKSLGYIR